MKELPILTLILLVFTSCHPTEEEVEILWKRHLEFKENKLSILRQAVDLDKESSKAISEIDSIKNKIRTESENLLEANHSELYLLVDMTTVKPLIESIRQTKFSDSRFAELKYNQFDKETGAIGGWDQEFCRKRTAAEALLLLTDLQFEILNFQMTAKSENPELLKKRNRMLEELTTHK